MWSLSRQSCPLKLIIIMSQLDGPFALRKAWTLQQITAKVNDSGSGDQQESDHMLAASNVELIWPSAGRTVSKNSISPIFTRPPAGLDRGLSASGGGLVLQVNMAASWEAQSNTAQSGKVYCHVWRVSCNPVEEEGTHRLPHPSEPALSIIPSNRAAELIRCVIFIL